MHKLKWRVGEVPMGRWRSFAKRSWPMAYFVDQTKKEHPAVSLVCEVGYSPKIAKNGMHPPIRIYVADYDVPPNQGTFIWRKLKAEAATLEIAKAIAQAFWDKNPDKRPKELSGGATATVAGR